MRGYAPEYSNWLNIQDKTGQDWLASEDSRFRYNDGAGYMKLTKADTAGILNDISNYLSKAMNVLKMAIQILDYNRLSTSFQKSVKHPRRTTAPN